MLRRLLGGSALARALAAADGAPALLMDDDALFFGHGSRRGRQLRGNGCLVATDRAVVFAMWLPRRTFVFPRDTILGVDRVAGHAGKSVGRPLLRLRVRGADGDEDTVGFLVDDPARWSAQLGAALTPEG